jgi:hypothetical protein
VDREISEKIDSFQSSVTTAAILGKLKSLKSTLNKDGVTDLMKELAKCDFTLYKEFLSRVKIFQSQSNEESLEELIKKELQEACKTSHSVANSIYAKCEGGFSEWLKEFGNVRWVCKNSGLWQDIKKYLIRETEKISELELPRLVGCGIRFTQEHIKRLCDTIKQNTFLNIVTNSNIHGLQIQKTHQALHTLGYTNSLLIGLKSLMSQRKEIRKLWPCKWSAVLVIGCDCEGDVADILLDILQEIVDREQSADNCNDNEVGSLVGILQKYQPK